MSNNVRPLGLILLVGICLLLPLSIEGQPKVTAENAKEHFELARKYAMSDDPRTEEEYRHAIADRGGVYPEAWRELSAYLARKQKFEVAASAFREYLRQTRRRANGEILRRLERAAELQSNGDSGEVLSAKEMVELARFVEGFGSKEAAIPYAEKALRLHPGSTVILIYLADLVRWREKDRALDLLNRAVTFEPNDPSLYVARGWCYFWAYGDAIAAEKDFRKSIELSKGMDASAWAGLGDSLGRQGRREEAVVAYRRYLVIRPKEAATNDGIIRRSIENLQNDTP